MMSKLFDKIIFLYLLAVAFIPLPVFAQNVTGRNATPPKLEQIMPVIIKGVEFIFGFAGVIAAAMVVYGAYMWMFAGGDPGKVKAAQGTLTWAVIGLIFFMLIVVFFESILLLLGVQLPMDENPFDL